MAITKKEGLLIGAAAVVAAVWLYLYIKKPITNMFVGSGATVNASGKKKNSGVKYKFKPKNTHKVPVRNQSSGGRVSIGKAKI